MKKTIKKEKFEFKKSLIEFFRPNKWKISIFLIFIFISLVLIFLGRVACYGGSCSPTPKLDIVYSLLYPIDNKIYENIFPDSVLIALELVYLYILSCLSYLIFHKIKENVKNK